MKTIYKLIVIIGISFPKYFYAQSKWNVGPAYQTGISTLYGQSKMNMEQTMSTPNYSIKLSSGSGIQMNYSFLPKWSWHTMLFYQQRGAKFEEAGCDCPPKYKINYGDVWTGINYSLTANEKINFIISAGITGSYRLTAYRENTYEAINIKNEIKPFNIGTFTSFGFNFKLRNSDILQTSLFFNGGFSNVFTGMLEQNGITGKNLLTGLQLSYLIDFSNQK